MKTKEDYPLLAGIETPRDLRRLPISQLGTLSDELRGFLLRSVAESGGHLAAGLGAVELTVALHYVFNTPYDRLVWDVGHQAYPHKILTGRRRWMHTIRKRGGLSGFPKRSESRYDTFGVAHAGTSISAALGMVLAQNGGAERRRVVAVIGDGALSAGMAIEALNHAGDLGADLLVILNDNQMSISPNVGALSRHLGRIVQRAQTADGAQPFAGFGFDYSGPVDGHDVHAMVAALEEQRSRRGPRLLHVVTRKGKGYAPAEADPVSYHGVSRFDPQLGLPAATPGAPSYTEIFGEWLCDMAEHDPRLLAITPAMREGSGLVEFSARYPERYFDVAIAEQHAVTLAAGMACEGRKPVIAIYSTFLQRAYDQLIHDVALQNLDVLLAIDRAGVVGPDGPTHAGSFDLSYLRCVPNLVVMAPADENEARQMLYTGFMHRGPAAVRYPRGTGCGAAVRREMVALPLGRAELRRRGKAVAILAFGAAVSPALQAGEVLDATVLNMRFVKPLDERAVLDAALQHDLLITVEDNVIAGGAGAAVTECLAAHQVLVPVIHLGLPDRFLGHGSRDELLGESGIDAKGILRAADQHFRAANAFAGLKITGMAR